MSTIAEKKYNLIQDIICCYNEQDIDRAIQALHSSSEENILEDRIKVALEYSKNGEFTTHQDLRNEVKQWKSK